MLKAKFKEQREYEEGVPGPLRLSNLTHGFDRRHAAKLFYQICGEPQLMLVRISR